MVRGWKRKLASVAVEEMLHLAQVTNMLTAIGGAPHFRRTNFPMPATAFPFGIELALEPFSHDDDRAARVLRDARSRRPRRRSARRTTTTIRARIVAERTRRASRRCRRTARRSRSRSTSRRSASSTTRSRPASTASPRTCCSSGRREAQANARYVDLDGELIAVVDRASACRAIEMIVRAGRSRRRPTIPTRTSACSTPSAWSTSAKRRERATRASSSNRCARCSRTR